MKKFAIKGLVALAAVVALSMFFSGTIKTISTAKVKLVTAKQGKLEEGNQAERTAHVSRKGRRQARAFLRPERDD